MGKSENLRPFKAGADKRRGRGPKKGAPNAGRPSKQLREALAAIREDPTAQDALLNAARDPKSPSFRTAWQLASQYDDERPGEKLDHRFPELPASERQDRVLTLLRKAKERKPA